jgi:hypothetical protein
LAETVEVCQIKNSSMANGIIAVIFLCKFFMGVC